MKKEAWLQELIQMARDEKKFKAKNSIDGTVFTNEDFIHRISINHRWPTIDVISKWTYEEIIEPEVVEFDLTVNTSGFFHWHQPEMIMSLSGKKWHIVATEILEGE